MPLEAASDFLSDAFCADAFCADAGRYDPGRDDTQFYVSHTQLHCLWAVRCARLTPEPRDGGRVIVTLQRDVSADAAGGAG